MSKFVWSKFKAVLILVLICSCRTAPEAGDHETALGQLIAPQAQNLPDPYQGANKSAGCAKQTQGGGVEDLSIQAGSLSRRYLRVMPKRLTQGKPMALVFWWHGAASSPELTRSTPNYNHSPELEKLTGDDVIWLHPRHIDGTSQTWDRSNNGRDFQFFDKLFTLVTDEFCIDLKKVFTIGVSNGGTFANHIASVRSSNIKGVVAVAVPAMGGSWRRVTMPSMLIQDNRDNFSSAQLTIRKMAQDAECNMQSVNLTAKTPASCFLLPSCKPDTPVAFCPWQIKSDSNPHDWPRFDGADAQIWRFLTSGKVSSI